jgi:hypothetical protein
MNNPKFDVRLIGDFVASAIEDAAVNSNKLLWAKVDEEPTPEQRIARATMVVRENFDGPGEVKVFRITIEEVSCG